MTDHGRNRSGCQHERFDPNDLTDRENRAGEVAGPRTHTLTPRSARLRAAATMQKLPPRITAPGLSRARSKLLPSILGIARVRRRFLARRCRAAR